jgi:phosphate butyryltransferase
MIRNFNEVIEAVQKSGIQKKIAIAAAQDTDVLTSAIATRDLGLAEFILVGDVDKINAILVSLKQDVSTWEIIPTQNDVDSANLVAKLIADRKADLPMKGLLQTSQFLKAILNKELGLVKPKALLSQATVVEYVQENRMMLITDCAINIAPTFEEKMIITQNAVDFCHILGIEIPNVAIIAPVEEVRLAIQSTVDAAMLSKAAQRKQLKGCVVDGPLALDNALSLQASIHKGIQSSVAGHSDILVMPDLNAGNILDKSLRYFADYKTAGCVLGANVPLIMTSRSDSPENKLSAIACALLQLLKI